MPTVYLAPGTFGAGGQFLTSGVLPLKQGLIYTYIAGGTTPQATYTTSAGNVQNANPIVLGVDGRPPSEIWLTSGSYRFDLKDSLGNLIKTYDDLSGLATIASYSATSGSSLIGWIRSAVAAVATTISAWLGWQSFNVKEFGALGDGVTDDSAAILACVNAAAAASNGAHNSRSSVYFPAGVYIVTSTAVFTPTNNTSLPGIHFYGAGWYTSIIRYGTLSGATWMYDNGATSRLSFPTFSDLGFEGTNPASVSVYTDVPTNAKGFKITSAGNEQGFKFFRCRWSYFDVDFDMEGTNTASEMKFFGCKITHTRSTVYIVNNPQSFNHEFYGCDLEVIYGDVFSIGASGGGAIKVYGGSMIMLSDTGAATYFFKNTGSTGVGSFPYIFDGMRMELRGDKTNLVLLAATSQFDLAFTNTLFEDQATIAKANWCVANSYATIDFRKCTFYEQNSVAINFLCNDTVALYGENGTITFDSCGLPIDWSDRCSVATVYGAIRAINCYGTNVGALATGVHYAHDFDMHWNEATAGIYTSWAGTGATLTSDGSTSNNSFRFKTAQIKLTTDFWKDEQTCKLPKNALIKAIHIRKPAGGADATATILRVTRNDKTGSAHLDSNNAAFNIAQTGDVDNYFYQVGATTNERTLRLYPTVAVTGLVQGGICIVEYY